MFIGVVGLGLIGGSVARAFASKTDNMVFGFDTNDATLKKAIDDCTVAGVLDDKIMGKCDVVIVALYPHTTVECLEKNAPLFKKDAVVIDCCGIKSEICAAGKRLSDEYGFTFIGGHPMAGIEKWGYTNSYATLFEKASMVLVPVNDKSTEKLDSTKEMFLNLGFGSVKVTTAAKHDEVIACTSQLAHIVSSAYAKSPTAKDFDGLSAGSFKDMTRVARMNDVMWSEIFIDNKEPLIAEIDYITQHLKEYREALVASDRKQLSKLIQDGTRLKEEFDSEVSK